MNSFGGNVIADPLKLLYFSSIENEFCVKLTDMHIY